MRTASSAGYGLSVRTVASRASAFLRSPPGGASLAVVAFIAITVWWLARDERVPDYDSAKHLLIAFGFADSLRAGDLLQPFEAVTPYPPLGQLVGALGLIVGGESVSAAVLAENLVWVPALALGCYGTARVAYDSPGAGLLAVVFALGCPIVIAQFHVFMIDVPAAAAVAVAVWLILASRRFSDPRISAAAGAAVAVALLVKAPTALFLAGPLLVTLARGGWRNWRGLALFALLVVVLAVPWYLAHLDELSRLTEGASTEPAVRGTRDPNFAPAASADDPLPPRWSIKNAGWYGWAMVNVQLLLPLTLFFVTGTVVATVRWLRRRDDRDGTPELVAGGLVGYVLATLLITLHDIRYTLPALVFVAVLGTAWIVRLERRSRVMATAALLLVVAANTLGASFGVGEPHRIELAANPPESDLKVRQLTLYSPVGFVVSKPERGGEVLDLMRAARRDGIRSIQYSEQLGPVALNRDGLAVFARFAGFPPADPGRRGSTDAYIQSLPTVPGEPPPCTVLADGTGVYMSLGDPARPVTARWCPRGWPRP